MASVEDYRSRVGPAELFGLIGAHQFCVMVKQGLREHHKMIDLGCGCLRGGKFFIPYLAPGNYTGIEPDKDLLMYGAGTEVGDDILNTKMPTFYYWDDFRFSGPLDWGSYDFVLAQSILTHAGSDLVKLIAEESHEVLAPGGKLVATFFDAWGTDLSSTRTGWLGNDVAGYSMHNMKSMIGAGGFDSVEVKDFGHPRGQLWAIATK